MAYTVETQGMDEIGEMLAALGEQAPAVAAKGLYDGAGVIADRINRGAESIRTEPFHYAKFITRMPSPEEKAAILSAGAGIAKFDKNGSEVSTSIGYSNSGYAEVNGKTKPIPMIANAINSGTSFMQPQPFFRKAVNSGKQEASNAIIKRCEAEFDALINQNGGK